MAECSRAGGISSRAYRWREEVLAAAREAGVRMKTVPSLAPLVTSVARKLMRMELRRLHKALSTTPIAGRYWMSCGTLLGWAREGKFLAHDTVDIDFAYRWTDTDKLIASIPALEAAGFRIREAVRRNNGVLVGVVLMRSGIQFDFLAAFPEGDRWQFYSCTASKVLVEEVPAQELVEFDFCGRRWLKVKDHERELACLYGDWRTPRPDWETARDSPAIVAREPRRRFLSDLRDLSLRI